MKKSLKNVKLTANFWLYEFIESTQIGTKGHELNWEYINSLSEAEKEKLVAKIKKIAKELQSDRDLINLEFKAENDNKEIGFEITSGFRSKEWEKIKGRIPGQNGRKDWSKHTIGYTADYRVICKDDELYNKAMKFLWNKDKENFIGGLAKKISSLPEHKNRQMRFIHKDFRGIFTRWSY